MKILSRGVFELFGGGSWEIFCKYREKDKKKTLSNLLSEGEKHELIEKKPPMLPNLKHLSKGCDSNFEIFFKFQKLLQMKHLSCTKIALEIYNNNDQQ